ncbi:uncharacterized protein Z520_03968 [Fonsecaea multimorphosa CBS 102226]|uniref:Spindle pole body component n=1 Tax=Fonsecaea multimorphosa CBS 102226 TaxID=1442371 RepID=A0A0D2K373_9EURO|nr:uncharacterized protein Z520_03968 [Fonsecaea multimorphosa CBS 102226]KIY00283.1 hypothetical protein Z520_03968 [Fonsecaea multimorphosa CBS 102226]OAL27116.1 hypothetical protein AYO22_03747 [Fonsecaea multimorphosa]
MSTSEPLDPFSVEHIKDSGPAPLPSEAIWDGFLFHGHLESQLLRLDESALGPLPVLKTDVFQLNLEDVSLQDLSQSSSAVTSDSENDQFESLDGDSVQGEWDNVWILPEIQIRKRGGLVLTWDKFLDETHQEPASAYLSETDPWVFNSILEPNDQSPPKYVKSDILLNAFFELCMGRDSVLFRWDEKDAMFVPQWQLLSARGYSSTLVRNCFDIFSTIGIDTRYLKSSFQSLDNSPPHLSSARVTFLSAARSVLYSVHKYLIELRPNILSLLQLKGIMRKVEMVVDMLKQCVGAVQTNQVEDSIILSLMQKAAGPTLDHGGLSALLQMLLSRTCCPMLVLLSEQIGLSSTQHGSSRGSFALISSADEATWESLFDSKLSHAISEAQKCLEILSTHSPDSSIFSATVLESSPLKKLEAGFHLSTISALQARAVAYEEAMRSLIVSADSSTSTSSLETPASESFDREDTVSMQAATSCTFRLQVDIFKDSTHYLDESKYDELEDQVIMYLEGQDFGDSPLQLDLLASLNLSVAPLVSAQHRLLSYSALRLLFEQHNLLGHLNLQKDLHLLGNAFFSSRLSTALFDPDQSSGEGNRRTSAVTGLRLHVRDTWPPAGSELRLVLMSILSDSLSPADRALDETMSFAIRDLPLEELEKCRDVDSIYALDFLRLQYAAPNEILGAVITPEILDKYDRVFQHLLRTLRMQAVAQSMLTEGFNHQSQKTPRGGLSNHKFVVTMHHFVSSIAEYYHNTAIELNWRKFQTVLHAAKARLDNRDYIQTLRVVKSLDHLRVLHERTLNKILGALLLKRNQAKLRHMLEEIYDVILRSAAERRKSVGPMDAENHTICATTDETTMRRLHKEFKSKVALFIDALRVHAQSAEKGPGKKHADELDVDDDEPDVNMFEYLLLKLDMFGYWTL